MSRVAAALLLCLAATAVSAQDVSPVVIVNANGTDSAPATLLDAAGANNDTTIGFAALNTSMLLDAAVRNSSTAVTLFLPNDEAFLAFLQAANVTAEQLLNSTVLDVILAYHIVLAPVPAAALNASQTVPTLLSPTAVLNITKSEDGNVTIVGGDPSNVANVVRADERAGASIIHVIDAVLLPTQEELDRALNGSGLNFSMGNMTLGGGGLIEPVSMGLESVPTNGSGNGTDTNRTSETNSTGASPTFSTTTSSSSSRVACDNFKGGKTAVQVTDADLALYDDRNPADVAELQRLCTCLYSPIDCKIGGRRLLRSVPVMQRLRW